MVKLEITYQPFTKAFALGYHSETVRTMVRQWEVMITNGLTMVACTKANRTRHGSVHQGNHYHAWYFFPGVNCKLRSMMCFTACRCMQHKTLNTHSNNHCQLAASKAYCSHSLAPTICQITKYRYAHLMKHLPYRR